MGRPIGLRGVLDETGCPCPPATDAAQALASHLSRVFAATPYDETHSPAILERVQRIDVLPITPSWKPEWDKFEKQV
eukprot:2018502-Pyramimonas_sp.AAC.1